MTKKEQAKTQSLNRSQRQRVVLQLNLQQVALVKHLRHKNTQVGTLKMI